MPAVRHETPAAHDQRSAGDRRAAGDWNDARRARRPRSTNETPATHDGMPEFRDVSHPQA